MTDPDPLPASEREVRAYAADSANPILRRHLTAVLAELDRVREALAQRLDPIETALEAQLGVAEEKIRQLEAELAEVERLLDVEHAAALLLDACDAREAAGMTTGADKVREFLRDVRRTT